MRVFQFIRQLSLSVFVIVVVAQASGDTRPNLLFIMTDQQRFDAMSCSGNTIVKTPNMDRIAREGVMFKNAYAANPVCVPSRASFLTGLSPVTVRVEGNNHYMSENVPDVPTFDSVLAENGYAAEYYGKWHTPYQFAASYDNKVKVVGNIKGAPSIIRAYQEWLVSKGVTRKEPDDGQLFSGRNQRPYTPIELDWHHHEAHSGQEDKMKLRAKQVSQYGRIDLPADVSYAAYTAEETIAAIDRLNDRPFTLTCSFDPPHPPMIVQEPYYSMYDPETIPVPVSINDPMDDSPYKEKSLQEDQLHYKDPEQIRHMRSIYYGMVREVDDWMGRILDKLDEHGIADNTLVIFTSDHGEMLGDHGMHSKMIFYEGSVHIPLLMRFPGRIKAGTVVEQPVSAMDVFPTILDYLDMPPQQTTGVSLRPFIEGRPFDHDVVSYSLGSDRPNYMIRSGYLKLLMGQDSDNKSINALYDLKADPHELRNLIITPIAPERDRARAKMMKGRLVRWLQQHEPHKVQGIKERELF